MATIKKVKKAQAGASMFLKGLKKTISNNKFPSGDLLPSSPDYAGIKNSPAKISGPEKQMGMAEKERAKKAAAKKAAASSPARSLKIGGKVKKAQKGKKLPLGASSAEAERDYAKSDSINNIIKKGFTSKQIWDMNSKGQRPSDMYQKSDSLRKEGDKKTKATGGVPKDYRLKKGGVAKKKMSMGGMMKKGGKMSKKK